MRQIDAGLGAGGTDVTGSAGPALRSACVCLRVARLGQMMKGDAELATRRSEQPVRIAEREWRERKRPAARRAPWLIHRARDAERALGARVVWLEFLVRERPVVGDPVERPQTEVAGVEPKGVSLPVQCAAADAAGALSLEPVGRVGPRPYGDPALGSAFATGPGGAGSAARIPTGARSHAEDRFRARRPGCHAGRARGPGCPRPRPRRRCRRPRPRRLAPPRG